MSFSAACKADLIAAFAYGLKPVPFKDRNFPQRLYPLTVITFGVTSAWF
jgi:hypothetical protein